METPKIGADVTSVATKAFSLKNVLLIVSFVVIVMLLMNWVFKQDLVDENGNTTGTMKFRMRSFKKTTPTA